MTGCEGSSAKKGKAAMPSLFSPLPDPPRPAVTTPAPSPDTLSDTPSIFVRVTSHRARKRMQARGVPLKWHYAFAGGGRFVLLTERQWEQVKDIPGLQRCREQDKSAYGECWNL